MEKMIEFHKLKGRSKKGYASWGAPWKKGTLEKDSGFKLFDENGHEIPVQSKIGAYWPDGSVKWSFHSADCTMAAGDMRLFAVREKENLESMAYETDFSIIVDNGIFCAKIPKSGEVLIEEIKKNGNKLLDCAKLLFVLEEREEEDGVLLKREVPFVGALKEVCIEENGNLKCMVKAAGIHKSKDGRELIPFVIRLEFFKDKPEIKITHTFLYDGNENKDFLKGIGIKFYFPIEGELWNRHVKFVHRKGIFHEVSKLLLSWRPKLDAEIYKRQLSGEILKFSSENENFWQAQSDMTAWNSWRLFQQSPASFEIQKKTENPDCCFIDCHGGKKSLGTACICGENGAFLIGMKNFWQKYPSGLWLDGICTEKAEVSAWFWSPDAKAMDFRHYDTKGHASAYYEGFDEVGARPQGIACTSELLISFAGKLPSDEEMLEFADRVQKPPVIAASPQYYHETGVFGRWSLPKRDTPAKKWIEEQLDLALDFYMKEIKRRRWYGLFNYGDFMHTYDSERHCWRYDMGGYAWQNTELVPTLWLWYSFLRTGREDVFTLAEEMSRHCSEVDVYHFGEYKGLGSRHNVRHWGCSCKEPRIAMAGHHRFYYYLAGDSRIGDIFDEVRDADFSTLNIDPLRYFYEKDKMVYPTHARTGPDWAAYCSNWLAEWERNFNNSYLEKIKTGIEDLKKAPLKLVSGSDFEYDPRSGHLRYIGENAAGGTHLAICMGGPQIWFELADLLSDSEWNEMLALYGKFYFASNEERQRLSGGLIGKREFSFPYMAASMGAFAAEYYGDSELAAKVWDALISELKKQGGFHVRKFGKVREIPWISTNFASQWCLNAICVLDFIGDFLTEE